MIGGIIYVCIGLLLALLLLKFKPEEETSGSYEGIVASTILFWPLICLLSIPFWIAHRFGWWKMPDD